MKSCVATDGDRASGAAHSGEPPAHRKRPSNLLGREAPLHARPCKDLLLAGDSTMGYARDITR